MSRRFVHRILKSSAASSSASSALPSSAGSIVATARGLIETEPDLRNARLVYFGEFHSEDRIVAFQTELVKSWSRRLACDAADRRKRRNRRSNVAPIVPRLHLVMEHISTDMQGLLDRYWQPRDDDDDDDAAFETLLDAYAKDGSEGHDLRSLRPLLQFCRRTAAVGGRDGGGDDGDGEHEGGGGKGEAKHCEVHLHGGFIPRPRAARLNKECPDDESKRKFFYETSEGGYLPQEGSAMYAALFEDGDGGRSTSWKLRGSSAHLSLIQSLMNGSDLYSPLSENNKAAVDGDCDDDDTVEDEKETPMSRLYQAQLLKDHAMGFRVASLMLRHRLLREREDDDDDRDRNGERQPRLRYDDRYLVVAGFGHVKHFLGAPDCVRGYLRAEALSPSPGRGGMEEEGKEEAARRRQEAALDLLLETNVAPTVGCQMLYEAYLEENYPPLMELAGKEKSDDEEEGEDDDCEGGEDRDDGGDNEDETEVEKQRLVRELYLRNPGDFDRYLLLSDSIRGPLVNFAAGAGGFDRPCAEYLYVYDDDDDNVITDEKNKCPVRSTTELPAKASTDGGGNDGDENDEVRAETAAAYERVGRTASTKGNFVRACAIMAQLGYSQEDISYLGEEDAANFQGVANPRLAAKIQRGEAVLDVGSGLGCDSILAARDCGAATAEGADSVDGSALSSPCGLVVGVDLASSEVAHARRRVAARGLDPRHVRFVAGDVERSLHRALRSADVVLAPPEDGGRFFDVCISNGAFCLVPDKLVAFANVYAALRPGGRMAVSTATIVGARLDTAFEWPVCMRMFARLESLKPMLEEVGFINVQILDAESPMEMELPIEALEDDDDDDDDDDDKCDVSTGEGESDGSEKRFKIHGRYVDQFKFLENMNMDDLCKIVTIYGEKAL